MILSGTFGTVWAADENGITLIQPTGGTVSYEIKNYMGSDCVYLYNTPNDGWRLVRYIVTDESGNDIAISSSTDLATGEIYNYFTKQNATITAEFEEAAHSITVTQPTGGTITASATKASEGDPVDLSCTVNDGYLFRRFIVTKTSDNSEVSVINGSNIAGQYAWYFNMPDEAVTVTAEISASHAITVQNPENGAINVHENGNVNATLSSAATGDSIEVIVGASTGYAVKSYAVTKTGDSSVQVDTAFKQGGIGTDKVIFSLTMPDYPVTVSAQTEAMAYPITWNATDCTVNGPSQGHVGDTITFTVTPSAGYSVRSITVNGEATYGIVRKSVNGGVYTYEMTLGTGDAFLNNGYTVNVVCDNEGEPGFPITKQFNMGGASITNSAGEEITRAEGGEQVTIKLLQSDGVDYTASCYFYPTGTDPLTPEGIKYANQLTGDNTFIMPFRDMTVLTQGTAKTFNLTVASGIEHGTVTANSSIPAYNFSVILTITPDTGYVLTKLIVDGTYVASQVSGNKYVFRMPAHDVSVSEAVFSVVEYTITYDGIDGATFTAANPTSYTIEDSFTLTNPTRTGYDFAGWTGTGLDEATETVTIAQGSTGARSYTANWTPNVYTITYSLNGGTADNPASYTIASADFKLTNPTRNGYTFTGWTLSGDNTVVDSDDLTIPAGSTGNKTYIAGWNVVTYTITYDLADGTLADGATNPASYTVESESFTLTNPTRDGYTFTGWTGTDLDEATLTATIPAGSTGNREYTATWTKNGFTPQDPDTPEFAYHSLILSGQIGVIFHVYAPEGASSKDYCMYFDVSGDKSQNTQPVNPFETLNEDGYQFFGFKCYINSVQMADDIHATLSYGDNESITETYTAKRYLDSLIADTAQSADVTALGKAIKDYGCYVQPVLADENGWTIGKKHAAMDSAHEYTDSDFTDAETATNDYAITCTVPEGSGIKDVSFALVLDSETAIELYLASKDTYTGNVAAYVDGGSKNMAVRKGSEYVVSIGNISAHKLGTTHTVSITTQYDNMQEVSFEVKLSALSYVQSAIHSSEAAMKRAVTSLWRYWDATMTYRKNRPEIYGGGE